MTRRALLAALGSAAFAMAIRARGASASDFPSPLPRRPPPPRPPPQTGRIIKVLPHYLDRRGRHTLTPSLWDRDAYQFELRNNPELRGGLRFDVQWRTTPEAPRGITLRLELRGAHATAQEPVIVVARAERKSTYAQWTKIRLSDEQYAELGELLSWRVTLWQGDNLLAEQKSFLW